MMKIRKWWKEFKCELITCGHSPRLLWDENDDLYVECWYCKKTLYKLEQTKD